MSELARIAYLFVPLIFGLAFHGCCIRFGWLSALARPIDGGRMLRGRPLFGPNKTFRGIVAVALGASVVMGVQADALHRAASLRRWEIVDYGGINGWALGAAFGALAMLAELPNSLLKRQVGVRPGTGARGRAAAFFYTLDQVDLVFGAWVALASAVPMTVARVGWSLAFVFVVHQVLSLGGYYLGMRASAR